MPRLLLISFLASLGIPRVPFVESLGHYSSRFGLPRVRLGSIYCSLFGICRHFQGWVLCHDIGVVQGKAGFHWQSDPEACLPPTVPSTRESLGDPCCFGSTIRELSVLYHALLTSRSHCPVGVFPVQGKLVERSYLLLIEGRVGTHCSLFGITGPPLLGTLSFPCWNP